MGANLPKNLLNAIDLHDAKYFRDEVRELVFHPDLYSAWWDIDEALQNGESENQTGVYFILLTKLDHCKDNPSFLYRYRTKKQRETHYEKIMETLHSLNRAVRELDYSWQITKNYITELEEHIEDEIQRVEDMATGGLPSSSKEKPVGRTHKRPDLDLAHSLLSTLEYGGQVTFFPFEAVCTLVVTALHIPPDTLDPQNLARDFRRTKRRNIR